MNPEFDHEKPLKTGVLLVNLGTPQAPTAAAIRRFLAEFLADKRVIELPRWFWLPLLHLVILPLRSRRVAHNYRAIWTEQGSPLLVYTQGLARKLHTRLHSAGGDQDSSQLVVTAAMRYGQPGIEEAIEQLASQQVDRLLVLPLYPQYSATTTASIFDELTDCLQRRRWLPGLSFIGSYHDHPQWVAAVAESIQRFWQDNGRGDRLLFSFHGIPKRYFDNGDPYHCHCQKSARLIAEQLGLQDSDWQLSFQSRVGREEWLQPYTDETVKALAADGCKRLQVVSPGFAVDCLETLEEIAIQNRQFFLDAGGRQLDYIPALNDSAAHVAALEAVLEPHLRAWNSDRG